VFSCVAWVGVSTGGSVLCTVVSWDAVSNTIVVATIAFASGKTVDVIVDDNGVDAFAFANIVMFGLAGFNWEMVLLISTLTEHTRVGPVSLFLASCARAYLKLQGFCIVLMNE
jgi:hypothetical protein